jgi:serine/threonine protein kinase
MAAVFKAYDSSLERYVAIKVIRTEIFMDQEFLKRFQREARALAQLDHPYILKVLDYGEQDGMPYLVMPFAPGGTLKERMVSPWPYQEAARLLAPIARALECAHQQLIIHRDVKPANILFTPSGSPILSDFGIAKMLDIGESMQLTGTGMGIGTPDYMAPEQWLGRWTRVRIFMPWGWSSTKWSPDAARTPPTRPRQPCSSICKTRCRARAQSTPTCPTRSNR